MATKKKSSAFAWETMGERQAKFKQAIHDHEVIFAIGPAGTGKTLVSTFMALDYLDAGLVDGIVISRPLVEAGRPFPALPGNMKQKTDPYLAPIDDYLKHHPKYQEFTRDYDQDEEKPLYPVLETVPLEFMRGRTFTRKFVCLDEAQNATRSQMEMFLTRKGHDTKMVITGDPSQTDLKSDSTGLAHAVRIFRENMRVAVIEFTVDDVRRSDFVGDAIRAYDQDRREYAQSQAGKKK